jgi:hypothetical protein
LVFAWRAVKLISARGLVDKLQFAYTGPWKVVAILDGALYKLEHAKLPNMKEKKHASDLSPYPAKLFVFEPLDGPDNRYGQLHKPISAAKFNEASIHGFTPISPYRTQDVRTSSNLLFPEKGFHWPTFSDLNNKLDYDLWESDPDAIQYRAAEMMEDIVPTFSTATAPGPLQLPLTTAFLSSLLPTR